MIIRHMWNLLIGHNRKEIPLFNTFICEQCQSCQCHKKMIIHIFKYLATTEVILRRDRSEDSVVFRQTVVSFRQVWHKLWFHKIQVKKSPFFIKAVTKHVPRRPTASTHLFLLSLNSHRTLGQRSQVAGLTCLTGISDYHLLRLVCVSPLVSSRGNLCVIRLQTVYSKLYIISLFHTTRLQQYPLCGVLSTASMFA